MLKYNNNNNNKGIPMVKQVKTPQDWKNITKKELYELAFMQEMFDNDIAEMYGVKRSAVAYKRRKFNLLHGIHEDAFRMACRDKSMQMINEANISDEARKTAIQALKNYYKDLKE